MTKSELIEAIARRQSHLNAKDVELAVKYLIEVMSNSLASGERIEIRGFGSFSLHFRPPRIGRNPKTGEAVACRASTCRISSPARTCGSASTPDAISTHQGLSRRHACPAATPASQSR
jgi:integration host factor subunit beta